MERPRQSARAGPRVRRQLTNWASPAAAATTPPCRTTPPSARPALITETSTSAADKAAVAGTRRRSRRPAAGGEADRPRDVSSRCGRDDLHRRPRRLLEYRPRRAPDRHRRAWASSPPAWSMGSPAGAAGDPAAYEGANNLYVDELTARGLLKPNLGRCQAACTRPLLMRAASSPIRYGLRGREHAAVIPCPSCRRRRTSWTSRSCWTPIRTQSVRNPRSSAAPTVPTTSASSPGSPFPTGGASVRRIVPGQAPT